MKNISFRPWRFLFGVFCVLACFAFTACSFNMPETYYFRAINLSRHQDCDVTLNSSVTFSDLRYGVPSEVVQLNEKDFSVAVSFIDSGAFYGVAGFPCSFTLNDYFTGNWQNTRLLIIFDSNITLDPYHFTDEDIADISQ